MVLQAYPDGRSHEPEAGVALVHHRVPVAEAAPADVPIHHRVGGATVAGWKQSDACQDTSESLSFTKVHIHNVFTFTVE